MTDYLYILRYNDNDFRFSTNTKTTFNFDRLLAYLKRKYTTFEFIVACKEYLIIKVGHPRIYGNKLDS